MLAHYDSIYLSPHLDDVALSCGGQVAEKTAVSRPVLILTITAGDPPQNSFSNFAASLHERWQLPTEMVARRRAEDIAACRILGADHLHWDIPDCIYRPHPTTGEMIYVSEADIFGELNTAELPLIAHLAQRLHTLPSAEHIFAPLTIGHHVDHLLTRAAAERCFGSRLWYYEDYPYARIPGALEAVIPAEQTANWQAQTLPLSPTALQAKMEAIAAFNSQISTFFLNQADLEEQIKTFTQKVKGERIWTKK